MANRQLHQTPGQMPNRQTQGQRSQPTVALQPVIILAFLVQSCSVLQELQNSLPEASILLGAYHKGANHWCLVIINLSQRYVSFLDPKGNVEGQIAHGICHNWTAYARVWNRETQLTRFPITFTVNLKAHALQSTTVSYTHLTLPTKRIV